MAYCVSQVFRDTKIVSREAHGPCLLSNPSENDILFAKRKARGRKEKPPPLLDL